MMIKMNKGQVAAFEAVKNWMRSRNASTFYLLRGYAGVGKTTMAMEIARHLRRIGIDVTFVAPTNKAVRVIDAKLEEAGIGCPRSTVHHAIYKPDDEKGSGFHYSPDKDILPKQGLVICDESSMVPQDMLEDLARAANEIGFRVLLMGDSFQLPPVSNRGKTVFQMGFPESELTQVMRQAGGSGILDLATALRARGGILLPNQGATDVQFMNDQGILNSYVEDIRAHRSASCIAWTNRTRVALNHAVRTRLFGSGDLGLHEGERVIGIDNGENLVNGEETVLPKIRELEIDMTVQVQFYKGRQPVMKPVRLLGFEDEECQLWLVAPNLDEASLMRGLLPADAFPRKWTDETPTPFGMRKTIAKEVNIVTFGYVITAHKSQGSQWDKVYVTEVQRTGDGVAQARWFYTAITRAAKELVLSQRLVGMRSSWEQICAIAAPFMTEGVAPVPKQQPVAEQPVAERPVVKKQPKPQQSVTNDDPRSKENVESLFKSLFATMETQQSKKEEKKAEPVPQTKALDLEASFAAIFAGIGKKKEEKKAEPAPQPVHEEPVEKPAPSEKKEDEPKQEDLDRIAKSKKIDEVNAMKTFVPDPKEEGESNRLFALRLTGMGL